MKKLILPVLALALVFALLSSQVKQKKQSIDTSKPANPTKRVYPTRSPSAMPADTAVSRSVFIPYWALEQSGYKDSSYETLYYFGIAGNKVGIIKGEPGIKGLDSFSCPDLKECILVVRLLDNSANHEILSDKNIQAKVIGESLEIAHLHDFSGIALDLELTSLSSIDTKARINTFVQDYYKSAKLGYKTFSFIIYGDVFYRRRPYDVSFISRNSDKVLIMAYDFHKSYGEPGPNFPFDRHVLDRGGRDDYGYDFKTMVRDFKDNADQRKLAVVFGMYGYDWTLNNQGTPLKQAKAITVNEVESLKLKPESNTAREKKIEYTDEESQKHVVWYEDEESAEVKINYLKEEGIGGASFWAYGYF